MLETIRNKLDTLKKERDEKIKTIEIEHKENLAALQKEAESMFNKSLERVRLEYEEACAQLHEQAQREVREDSQGVDSENGVRWDDGHWHEPKDDGELSEYTKCVRWWKCSPEAHYGQTLTLTCRCGALKFINFTSHTKQEHSVWHTRHLKLAERNDDRVQEALSRTLARLR